MGRMVTRAMRRKLEEEEEELGVDRISLLPDAILGEIVSFLPTKDGGRTQVLSSRWRDIWRSAPLNIDTAAPEVIPLSKVSGILSSHRGPGRRFSICLHDIDHPAVILGGWFESPALSNLQELEFNYSYCMNIPRPPLPSSVHRFSSTLRVASFRGCGGFPDGDSGNRLNMPVLRMLSLISVEISDSSLCALLDGCPVLESLLLSYTEGLSCIRVVSATLRSVAVSYSPLKQVIIEDAPNLNRLLIPYWLSLSEYITVSVVSAPKLVCLGPLSNDIDILMFGTTIFQGSKLVSLITSVHSVKELALSHSHLSLEVIINFMKFFPCLEKLYIKTYGVGEKNIWSHKYRNLIGNHNISLKKIFLRGYRGNKSHVDFAKFFVLNARRLQSMIFRVPACLIASEWIERQHRLLRTKDRASRDAHFDFVDYNWSGPLGHAHIDEVAHDLTTTDPFERFDCWG